MALKVVIVMSISTINVSQRAAIPNHQCKHVVCVFIVHLIININKIKSNLVGSKCTIMIHTYVAYAILCNTSTD